MKSLFCRVPVHTLFESHPEDGICAIAISQDDKYLATISTGTVQVKRISPFSELCRTDLEVFLQCSSTGEVGIQMGREGEQVCRVMLCFC